MNFKRGVAVSSASAEQTALPASRITVTPSEQLREISPYIYGINFGVKPDTVTARSIRLGGNRLSAYNWENNMFNAGSDYFNTSDMYLVNDIANEFKAVPGGPALALAAQAQSYDIPYTLLTLQMLGYVTSDEQGRLTEENGPPSEYWVKVENRKNGELRCTEQQGSRRLLCRNNRVRARVIER